MFSSMQSSMRSPTVQAHDPFSTSAIWRFWRFSIFISESRLSMTGQMLRLYVGEARTMCERRNKSAIR